MVVLAVLAMVGYGLYVGLNNGFQFQSGQTETPDWLKEEMHSGGGLPQVAPPQVTPPQPPQESGPTNPVSLGQPVSLGVPQAQYPSKPGTQPPVAHLQQPKAPIAGPEAGLPANPSANQPIAVARSPQTTASGVPGEIQILQEMCRLPTLGHQRCHLHLIPRLFLSHSLQQSAQFPIRPRLTN